MAEADHNLETKEGLRAALRDAVNRDPDRFDRVTILKETLDPVEAAARTVIRAFGAPPQR